MHEQFGQVLVEAMACGVPAIAVERGGPATIVDHAETGWLVAPDDRDAFTEAIVEAVNDPMERELMGRAARGEAVENYSWNQIGARIWRSRRGGSLLPFLRSGSRRKAETRPRGSVSPCASRDVRGSIWSLPESLIRS